MPAIAPILSRTNRHFGATAKGPDTAPGPARRWGPQIVGASRAVQLAPGVRAPGVLGGGYTLTADTVAFASNWAGALATRGIAAAATSFATTFNAAGLVRSTRTLTAQQAIFGSTFGAVTMRRGRTTLGNPIAFATSFSAARLLYGRTLVAVPASFLLTGSSAGLKKGGEKRLNGEPVAFGVTFGPVTLRAARRLLATPADFATAFSAATLTAGTPVVPPRSSAEADLLALLRPRLSTPVVLNAADEGMLPPYVVMTGSHDLTYALLGPLMAERVTFSLACWAPSALEAEQIADEVQTILDDHEDDHYVIGREGGFDQATTMDVAVLTVDRWI